MLQKVRNFRLILLLLAFATASVIGCNGSKEPKEPVDVPPDESLSVNTGDDSTEQTMADVVENLSSPIEMAKLIKKSGVAFSSDYLAPTDNVDDFNTSFKKAFALGVYGADLGYLNIYNKTSMIVNYISAIKKLSEDLRVSQFFDFEAIKSLATNNENMDSLLYLSVSSFNRMDKHLRENNRSNVSVLVVAGMWIEGAFLATQVAKKSNIFEINERIGEQKLILGELLPQLRRHSSDANFVDLIADFESITEKYKDVKIEYVFDDPIVTEKDGRMIIEQQDKSIVHITDEQLKSIIQIVEEIRNKRTKNITL